MSRRAVVDIVRGATLGSYGVIGFARGGIVGRIGERIGFAPAGLDVRLVDGIEIELDLVVAHHLPIAEVARQVDSAVRYAVHRALGRDVDRLVIHIGGLRLAPVEPIAPVEPAGRTAAVVPDDLAASGTDVA